MSRPPISTYGQLLLGQALAPDPPVLRNAPPVEIGQTASQGETILVRPFRH